MTSRLDYRILRLDHHALARDKVLCGNESTKAVASPCNQPENVRFFWHLADIVAASKNVRFTPESGHIHADLQHDIQRIGIGRAVALAMNYSLRLAPSVKSGRIPTQ